MANQQISNVATSSDYTDACTLGPSLFESITVQVWNASCVMQTYELGPGGDYQLGDWQDETLQAAGGGLNNQIVLARCGGVRFKDNPGTPGTHARIIAVGITPGGVQQAGAVGQAGTLAAAGGVTSAAALTGSIDSDGTILAGTGFTITKGAAGLYAINFTTAFQSPPVVLLTVVKNLGSVRIISLNPLPTVSVAHVVIQGTAATGADEQWQFVAFNVN